jgi:caa(3)-type oxidase subunit IV
MANLSLEAMQKEYMKVFSMLGIFTALTVIAAKIHFPDSWGHTGELLHVIIGLAIAVAKAAMVVWIFMHITTLETFSRVK